MIVGTLSGLIAGVFRRKGSYGPGSGVGGGPSTTLDLNFAAMAASGTLDSRVTYSGASLATLTDATGAIAYKPHNLLTWSAVSTTNWSLATNVTVTAGTVADPEGALTGATVSWGAASAGTGVRKGSGVNGAANTKAIYVRSDVAGGTVELVDADTIVGVTVATLTTAWQRVSLSEVAGSQPSSGGVWLRKTASSPATVYVCWATFNLGSLQPYYPTTGAAYYGPRFTYDPVTHAALGLLVEEQRTNLLLWSEAFDNAAWSKVAATVTANAGAAPDGTTSADLIVPNAASAVHYVQQAPWLVNSTIYTWSVYAKASGYSIIAIEAYSGTAVNYANVNVSTGSVGTVTGGLVVSTPVLVNGFYRFSVTMTTAATGVPKFAAIICAADATYTFTGDGASGVYIWGAQLELGLGAFATTYIPTTSASVTRAADSATMTGSNFSSWFNATQGTFVANAVSNSVGTNNEGVVTVDQDGSNTIGVGRRYTGRGTTTISLFIYAGAVTQTDSQAGAIAVGVPYKVAARYAANNFAISVNGGAPTTDALGSLPSAPVQLLIGRTYHNEQSSGPIARLRYYNTALTNAQLQALTT